ncbi:hypothetical protein UT300007_28280 [Clostridium sp. CTA-7]
MRYKIITGKYETGTEEQKDNYRMLFGDKNIQENFDLYFHWYNIIHELGHILISHRGLSFSNADEEQFVNDFAVAYWMEVDKHSNLLKVKDIVTNALKKIPRPIGEDIYFLDYFRENWGNFEMSVAMYGFFQMACVASSLSRERNLKLVLSNIGYENITIDNLISREYEINCEAPEIILKDFIMNMSTIGIEMPSIELEIVDNPDIQCCENKN